MQASVPATSAPSREGHRGPSTRQFPVFERYPPVDSGGAAHRRSKWASLIPCEGCSGATKTWALTGSVTAAAYRSTTSLVSQDPVEYGPAQHVAWKTTLPRATYATTARNQSRTPSVVTSARS